MKVINFSGVWEKYRIKFIKQRNVCWEEVWALEDINFKAEKGEIIGIIGKNGAGKTTLLKLITGMLVPDKGEVYVKGKVSALMELGAGFNPEFTGIENISLNAAVYGLSEANLQQRMGDIIKFAGLDKFINAPIKYYSQGMYMRLAFALAIFVEPDILLIDDILAVGDAEAQEKCIKKIFGLKQMGKTIILVSHDMNMVSKLCDQLILLEKGRLIQKDSPIKVIPYYLETIGDKKGIAVLEKEGLRVVFNNGKVTFGYNGFSLTKAMGGYVSFFIPSLNSWSSSINLSWQVESFGTDKIVAEGKSYEGVLSQIWTLQLEKDCLQWQTEVRGEDIKQSHVDLFFMSQYESWETLSKVSDFAPFISKSNWQDLGLNSCSDVMLGLSGAWQYKDRPGLILEQKAEGSLFKLFNTGYEQEARVIQWDLDSKIRNSVFIKIFPEEDKFVEHIRETKQKFSLKQQEEQVRLRAKHTISSGDINLFADINEKTLRLYYKGKEITRGAGLHSSFLVSNIWYDLSSCEWQVKKEDKTLILSFFWDYLKFKQLWKLSFSDDKLLWRVDYQSFQPFKVALFKFGLLLNSEYKSFFCGRQQENFPQYSDSWQDMSLIEPQANFCGLREQADFPAVILENKNNYGWIIQNGDRQRQCRALQLSIPKEDIVKKKGSLLIPISILKEESSITAYLTKQKEQYSLKQQEERDSFISNRTITCGDLRLFADDESMALRIFFKNKELTHACGLHYSFNNSKESFDLSNAQWKIENISRKRIILSLTYPQVSVAQIWDIQCIDENTLRIKLEIESSGQVSFADEGMRLELKDQYQRWMTPEEKGDLSDSRYINNVAPIRLKDNRIPGVVLISRNIQHSPHVLLQCTLFSENRFFNIYKRKEKYSECIGIYFGAITSRKKQTTSLSKHTYFEGEIVFGKVTRIEKFARKLSVVELNSNNLKFVFNQGKGGIFLKEDELTSGLGVYTSVRSLGVWYDSCQAVWEVKKKENNKLTLKGFWPHIALSQTWQIKMVGKNLIFWQVNMKAYEQLDLEICQANVMLCTQYKNWAVSKYGQGNFLDEYTKEYDILPFRFWYGKTDWITVEAETLPRVCFQNDTEDEDLRAIIENTDDLYQARLIQYQKANIHKMLPGKYLYFKGVIKIDPQK